MAPFLNKILVQILSKFSTILSKFRHHSVRIFFPNFVAIFAQILHKTATKAQKNSPKKTTKIQRASTKHFQLVPPQHNQKKTLSSFLIWIYIFLSKQIKIKRNSVWYFSITYCQSQSRQFSGGSLKIHFHLLTFHFLLFAVEKDPYPVDALPTCNHALSVCQQERKCIKLFEDFKLHCKVRENKCRMEDK